MPLSYTEKDRQVFLSIYKHLTQEQRIEFIKTNYIKAEMHEFCEVTENKDFTYTISFSGISQPVKTKFTEYSELTSFVDKFLSGEPIIFSLKGFNIV